MTTDDPKFAALNALSPSVRRAVSLLVGGLLIRKADGGTDWGGLRNAAWKAMESLSPEVHDAALEILDCQAAKQGRTNPPALPHASVTAMTADDLRAIAERHANAGAWQPSMSTALLALADARTDIAALLSLVRALIEPFPDGCPPMYDHLCQWCGYGDEKVEHDSDCIWRIAQGAAHDH